MSDARSAKMRCILGATLIASVAPYGVMAGMTDSKSQGISGADVAGISGADVAGISGADVAGISGADVAGISGADVAGISGADVLGISGADVAGISGADLLVLAGPVDSIDPSNGIFTSVGQSVMASQAMLSGISVGDFVTVNGSIVSSGWLYADSLSISSDMYVPGATQVFVTGIPSEIDSTRGQAKIGELTIDYTAAMSAGAIPHGMSVGFSGIQPVSHGLLVSDEVKAVR